MFGDVQLPYVYGWIKKSLEMFQSGSWMAGQVLVLCGEPGAGKNLLASLLQMLFGGRKLGEGGGMTHMITPKKLLVRRRFASASFGLIDLRSGNRLQVGYSEDSWGNTEDGS